MICPGDRYELSQGHKVYCMPTGMAGANRTTDLGAAITSDPDVARARTDGGYSWSDDTLRAPDISVGDDDDGPGWAKGAPRLAR